MSPGAAARGGKLEYSTPRKGWRREGILIEPCESKRMATLNIDSIRISYVVG